MDSFRNPLKRQTIPIERKAGADEDLPNRALRIKESSLLGSGSSGVVRAIKAELVRYPNLLKDPRGWLFPQTREVAGYAIKITREDRVGEARQSYNDCRDAGLTVPSTYKLIELNDGRSAFLTSDLRKHGFVVADGKTAVSEGPTSRMSLIKNFDDLLKNVFDEVMRASFYKNYGLLLGGDSIFFMMPKQGGVGEVRHLFGDFDRMHDQYHYNSVLLSALSGKPQEYQKEIARINIAKIERAFEGFLENFVDESVREDYLSKLKDYTQTLAATIKDSV